MQCERLPNDQLPEWRQQKPGNECVALIEGKLSLLLFRLALDEFRKRSARKMCNDACVAQSPKPMATTLKSLAEYGSATLDGSARSVKTQFSQPNKLKVKVSGSGEASDLISDWTYSLDVFSRVQ